MEINFHFHRVPPYDFPWWPAEIAYIDVYLCFPFLSRFITYNWLFPSMPLLFSVFLRPVLSLLRSFSLSEMLIPCQLFLSFALFRKRHQPPVRCQVSGLPVDFRGYPSIVRCFSPEVRLCSENDMLRLSLSLSLVGTVSLDYQPQSALHLLVEL